MNRYCYLNVTALVLDCIMNIIGMENKPNTRTKSLLLNKKQKASIQKAFQLSELEIDILVRLNIKYRNNSKTLLHTLLPK